MNSKFAHMSERASPERRKDKIYEELYVKKEKKGDVKTEDKDFEKNKQECTFKPSIGDPLKRANKVIKKSP